MFNAHTLVLLMAVATVGGIVGLDRTAAGQFMVSQPVIAGPLCGWMLGDTAAGLVVGAVLELIWVLDMPIGTFVPANATIATVSATAIAILGSPAGAQLDMIGFCILMTTGMVPITMFADGFVRKRNAHLAEKALAAPGMNAERKLSRAQLRGLAVFFLKSFVLYTVLVPTGLYLAALFERAPDKVHDAMALFVKLLPLLGAALVLRKLSISTLDRFFLGGFIIAATVTLATHAPALVTVLLVIVAGFLGIRYSERG